MEIPKLQAFGRQTQLISCIFIFSRLVFDGKTLSWPFKIQQNGCPASHYTNIGMMAHLIVDLENIGQDLGSTISQIC